MSSWGERLWRLMGACLALVVLAGCVAAPIAADRELSGDKGAVVLKLVTNGIDALDPAETLDSIRLLRDPPPGSRTGTPVILTRTRATTHGTAVFSGVVYAGHYTIDTAIGRAGDHTYWFPIGAMLGSGFQVISGEVTVLGTVLVQPLGGLRFNAGFVPPDAEMAETVEQLYPAMAAQTRGKPVHGFDATPELDRRARIAATFKQFNSVLNGFWQTPQGSLYAGSRFGAVVWRGATEARWHRAHVGSWKEVLSVRPYQGGLLVSGEEGLLRYSSDEGRTWRTLVPPDTAVLHAAVPLADGRVLAVSLRDAEWTAYVSDDVFAGQWRKLGSFQNERSLNVTWQRASVVVADERVGVMMANGEYFVVDARTGTIDRRSTGLSMFRVATLPDGMLVMQGALGLRTTLVSTDAGKTWDDLKTSRFINVIAFVDRNRAWAVAPIAPGIFAGDYALMVTDDAGKTWRRTGVVPGGVPADVRDLVVDRADGGLLAFMHNGQVLRSTDEGRNWSRVL